MNEIIKKISDYGILPVIKINDAEKAVPLAKALIDGGLPLAEITFRTDEAEESIKNIIREFPEMLVGAGTVLTIDQLNRAIEAGAKFIVSPGFNPKIVSYCIDKGITVIPGVSNPSDMELAMEMGLEVVKFFPAELSGGVDYLKSVGDPYRKLKFIPTGGINTKNLNDYLSQKNVIACGGTWIVKENLISEEKYETITNLTKEAIKTMLGFKIGHVGINAENDKEAQKIAQAFVSLFDFEYRPGSSSIFTGEEVEVMKSPYLGKNGHIAIKTNSVERAMAYLKAKGVKFNESTRNVDETGKINAIYLEGEIGGFAVHLKK